MPNLLLKKTGPRKPVKIMARAFCPLGVSIQNKIVGGSQRKPFASTEAFK